MSRKKTTLITCGVITAISILALSVFIVMLLLGAIFAPSVSTESKDQESMRVARALNQSLSTSCEMYVAQEQIRPEKFSQFVAVSQNEAAGKILNLDNIRIYLLKPDSQSDLDTNNLDLEFTSGLKVTYNLEKSCSIKMIIKK